MEFNSCSAILLKGQSITIILRSLGKLRIAPNNYKGWLEQIRWVVSLGQACTVLLNTVWQVAEGDTEHNSLCALIS